jgi:hypothetical protein
MSGVSLGIKGQLGYTVIELLLHGYSYSPIFHTRYFELRGSEFGHEIYEVIS